MHAVIGKVISTRSGMHKLSAVHVLGLARKVKNMLETPGAVAELAEEGSRIFLEEKRPTSVLTIIGASPRQGIESKLRAIGFARAGNQWGGTAIDIAPAVSLARQHSLTLLRYEDDHRLQVFVLKGEDQPALEKLMVEARVQKEETKARVAALLGGDLNPDDGNTGPFEEPTMGTQRAESDRPALVINAESGGDEISPIEQALSLEESAEAPKPAKVQMGLKCPEKPDAR